MRTCSKVRFDPPSNPSKFMKLSSLVCSRSWVCIHLSTLYVPQHYLLHTKNTFASFLSFSAQYHFVPDHSASYSFLGCFRSFFIIWLPQFVRRIIAIVVLSISSMSSSNIVSTVLIASSSSFCLFSIRFPDSEIAA